MSPQHDDTKQITRLILDAREKARKEVQAEPEPEMTQPMDWPISCTVGPGLEGAIACESQVGYVNGAKGWLLYCGYDIFELCAYSSFEEVTFLLLHGDLPTQRQFKDFKAMLAQYRHMPKTKRLVMTFPIEEMNAMAALRLGTNLMRYEFSYRDYAAGQPNLEHAISADEDSIPMETRPRGEQKAIYEFKYPGGRRRQGRRTASKRLRDPADLDTAYHLVAGAPSIAGAISRLRTGHLPLEPDPELSHAGNFLYMMTGKRPTPTEERIMDVALILHADHGMNASTFASLVVASTLSDMFFAVGAGIGALNGPLHGGANEQVLLMLREIGRPENVGNWFRRARQRGEKVAGFGHRVYKAYDPRARVLGPLAEYMARQNPTVRPLFRTARALEKLVVSELGKDKGVFPNVDFYSGLVYSCLGIVPSMFPPVFAVSRVSGWAARILEYLQNNRIFRPRAMYTGPFDTPYVPIGRRR
jgi:citrate synthase